MVLAPESLGTELKIVGELIRLGSAGAGESLQFGWSIPSSPIHACLLFPIILGD